MVAKLVPHPESKPKAVESIRAGIGRETPDAMFVMFKLEGDLSRIRIERRGYGGRTDSLWQSTCFECFVRDAGQPAYREFNLSPRGGWAVYDFDSYRAGMTNVADIGPIIIQEETDRWLTLQSHLAQRVPTRPRRMLDWRIGLSAVIEETDGTKSYWALAHPPGKPDFHHPDCFTLELPPPTRQ